MTAILRIGTEVSTIKSSNAPLLALQEGKRRRTRQRIQGIIIQSVSNGIWRVKWSCGAVEDCSSGILKKVSEPSSQSMATVVSIAKCANVSQDPQASAVVFGHDLGIEDEVRLPRQEIQLDIPAMQVNCSNHRNTTTNSLAVMDPDTQNQATVLQEPLTLAHEVQQTTHVDDVIPANLEEVGPIIEDHFENQVTDDVLLQEQEQTFIYDEDTLAILLNDRFLNQRVQSEVTIQGLLGSSTTVRGVEWTHRGDILPWDDHSKEYSEIGLRGRDMFTSLDVHPCNARINEVIDRTRIAPRNQSTRQMSTLMSKKKDPVLFKLLNHLYPGDVKMWLKKLNDEIKKRNNERSATRLRSRMLKEATISEYWAFIGIIFMAALTKSGGIEGLYNNNDGKNGIIERPSAEQYMTKTRFKEIKSIWVEQFIDKGSSASTDWWKMSKLIDEFNLNRKANIAASRIKTMDESMSAYRPQKNKTGNLPNISYIQR